MFEQFSSSYYLGRLYVEPYDGDHAVIQRADHEHVNRELYATDEGVQPLDTPLVMKLGGGHFPVLGDDSVPSGTLAVPAEFTARNVDLPDRREVLLATADRADELLRYSGYAPASGR